MRLAEVESHVQDFPKAELGLEPPSLLGFSPAAEHPLGQEVCCFHRRLTHQNPEPLVSRDEKPLFSSCDRTCPCPSKCFCSEDKFCQLQNSLADL